MIFILARIDQFCFQYGPRAKELSTSVIEATSSKKVCATSVSTGDQGGAPTLGQ